MNRRVQIGPISLTVTEIVLIKVCLSLALAAAFFVPHPWNIPVGITANMLWMWRL
jgi:hypothetical protein